MDEVRTTYCDVSRSVGDPPKPDGDGWLLIDTYTAGDKRYYKWKRKNEEAELLMEG